MIMSLFDRTEKMEYVTVIYLIINNLATMHYTKWYKKQLATQAKP